MTGLTKYEADLLDQDLMKVVLVIIGRTGLSVREAMTLIDSYRKSKEGSL